MRLPRRTLLAAASAAGLGGCAPSHRSTPVTHQPGVVTPPEPYAVLAAFDVRATNLTALLDRIQRRDAPLTLAVGASIFDGRFGLAGHRPRRLAPMPDFPNDVLDPAKCHGDLLFQIGAATADQAAAVVADLQRVCGADAVPRWRIDGFRAENVTTAAGLPSTRNLFGFREGAGNPDPGDPALMDRLVWTGDDEPEWAAGGTYQVVRLIRFAGELWNRDPLVRQEAAIGRHRSDGSPLAGGGEDAPIDYSADPDGQLTPLDAHIRRANPRTPQALSHRILRRGWSYRRTPGDEGLIFVCFQRDPSTGFAAAQHRLTGEALERYVLPFGGGYYFVPPSIDALRLLSEQP